jgi:hypothetical protein
MVRGPCSVQVSREQHRERANPINGRSEFRSGTHASISFHRTRDVNLFRYRQRIDPVESGRKNLEASSVSACSSSSIRAGGDGVRSPTVQRESEGVDLDGSTAHSALEDGTAARNTGKNVRRRGSVSVASIRSGPLTEGMGGALKGVASEPVENRQLSYLVRILIMIFADDICRSVCEEAPEAPTRPSSPHDRSHPTRPHSNPVCVRTAKKCR